MPAPKSATRTGSGSNCASGLNPRRRVRPMIDGRSGSWETVIGLEVHAQIVSNAKLFSGAATRFGAEPNTQVSPVDAAFPGMLPVINRHCVEQAVKTGLGLQAQINCTSVFDRKNYFYPDLPAGYQISQYSQPIVGHGRIVLDLPDGSTRTIGITRLHLEQDAGKSLHDQHPHWSFVDLNRAGIGLMEIVSEPDLRSAEEAGLYLRKLRTILRYLGTCDGNMEEGSLRCDANVSVRRPGAAYGTRCEIKNLNSVRHVMQAIEYEAHRQVEVIEQGGQVVQETRLFDVARGVTRPMRSKEDAHDYRYFPDPDLVPLVLDPAWVEELRAGLPELPDAKKARFVGELGLSPEDAAVLVAEQATALYFEQVARGRNPKTAANWVMGDVFAEMVATGADPGTIVERKGLRQVTDADAIAAAIDDVLAAQADKVAQYRAGRDKLYGFFVGQVMRATGGKANPALVNELLTKKLAG